jgi:hypothetical protein
VSAEPTAFMPRFLDGTPHVPQRDDAYVQVRLADVGQADAAMTVYLPNGTAIVVSKRYVVRLSRSNGDADVARCAHRIADDDPLTFFET